MSKATPVPASEVARSVRADKKRNETHTQLLKAAGRVFARLGFADTTVDHIASEAKVSRPAFYLYFASKQEVFAQVVAQVRDEFVAVHDVPDDVDVSDPVGLARAASRAMLVASAEHHALLRVIEHQAIYDAKIAEMWAEIQLRPMRRASRYVRRMMAEGTADPAASPEVIGEAIIGIFFQFGPHAPSDPKAFDELVEQLSSIFLRLLGFARPAGQGRGAPHG